MLLQIILCVVDYQLTLLINVILYLCFMYPFVYQRLLLSIKRIQITYK